MWITLFLKFLKPVAKACHNFHMRNKSYFLILNSVFILNFLSSGAVASPVSDRNFKTKKDAEKSLKTSKIEILNKSKVQQLQDEKDRQLLLKRKSQLSNSNKSLEMGNELSISAQKSFQKMNEDDLYSSLIKSYQAKDKAVFDYQIKIYMKKYSQHSRADDVLFLAGNLATHHKDYGMSLQYYNKVLSNYPYSNKTVSALYAKGAVLKKMNLEGLAKDVFQAVVVKYPGSLDASRAEKELRLLK